MGVSGIVSNKVLEAIKAEITNDPEKRGYAGKTDAQIRDLLNMSYDVQTVVTSTKPPRISQILIGVPFAPNILTDEKEIANAKAYAKEAI